MMDEQVKNLSLYGAVDHIAIAVKNLDAAITQYVGLFGFKFTQRREVKGKFSGMISAELDAGNFSIVLVQGTSKESQVSRYIEEYGSGVQHVAIGVEDLDAVVAELDLRGTKFATTIINGEGLRQIFTQRDENTGMMFEFIERKNVKGFEADNIQSLFSQLEKNDAF